MVSVGISPARPVSTPIRTMCPPIVTAWRALVVNGALKAGAHLMARQARLQGLIVGSRRNSKQICYLLKTLGRFFRNDGRRLHIGMHQRSHQGRNCDRRRA